MQQVFITGSQLRFVVFLFTQVTNIDGVLEKHNDFLDRCLKDCMLTNIELLKVRAATSCKRFDFRGNSCEGIRSSFQKTPPRLVCTMLTM